MGQKIHPTGFRLAVTRNWTSRWYSNSKTFPQMLKEDLEARGPVRLSEVEAEQKELLKIVRRLADEGQIVMGGGGDDEYV